MLLRIIISCNLTVLGTLNLKTALHKKLKYDEASKMQCIVYNAIGYIYL